MKIFICFVAFLNYSLSVNCEKNLKNDELYNLVLNKPGNISITGVFNVLEEENCNFNSIKGLEEMASMIWIVEALNKFNYLPGISIGFHLYEVCLKNSEDEINFRTMLKTNAHANEENVLRLGTLTTAEFHTGVYPSEEQVILVKHMVSDEMFVELVVQLLTNLQWVTVDSIITDSEQILNLFSQKTTEEEICVRVEYLISNGSESHNFTEINDSKVIIIIAEHDRIFKLLQKDEMKNESLKIILVPTDLIFHTIKDLSRPPIVLLPSIGDKNILTQFIKGDGKHRDFFNHKEPTKSPLFVGVAASILSLLKPLKNIQLNLCGEGKLKLEESCMEFNEFLSSARENKTFLLSSKSLEVSPDDVESVLKILKIDFDSNDEMFLYIASVANGNASEDAGIFQIFNPKAKKNFQPILLMINDNLLNDREVEQELETKFVQRVEHDLDAVEEFRRQKTETATSLIELFQSLLDRSTESVKKEERHKKQMQNLDKNLTELCDSSRAKMCENFAKSQLKNRKNHTKLFNEGAFILWRHTTWVTVNTCLGMFDLIFTALALIFFVSRICKRDTFEGSPHFIISVMVASIFMFAFSIFYHLEMPSLNSFCHFRLKGPPLAYATLFSLLLSRSLMLASSEGGGGFANHINGYLHSILFIFIFGVQISITSQQWFYEKFSAESKCLEIHVENKIIYSLGYECLLLGLLLCTCPLIVRSKRNRREGFLISIAVIFITLVWCCWLAFFFLLPLEEKDAAVAIGLNSTAAVLVICIFIPKIYFMIAGGIRSQASHTLPAFDLNMPTETLNKSNQGVNALYFGTVTYRNSRLGISNPNFYGPGSSGTPRENMTD